MATCECGCGQTCSGEFSPGHDQKLRVQLERRVGGLLRLRDLIDATESHRDGQSTEGEFAQRARALLTGTGSRGG